MKREVKLWTGGTAGLTMPPKSYVCFTIREGGRLKGTLYIMPSGLRWYRAGRKRRRDDLLSWREIIDREGLREPKRPN